MGPYTGTIGSTLDGLLSLEVSGRTSFVRFKETDDLA